MSDTKLVEFEESLCDPCRYCWNGKVPGAGLDQHFKWCYICGGSNLRKTMLSETYIYPGDIPWTDPPPYLEQEKYEREARTKYG